MFEMPIIRRPHFTLDTLLRVAQDEGLPAEGLETRWFQNKPWKIEVLSPWGWPDVPYHQKVNKARAIADRLEWLGMICSFDVLETGGFDAVFTLEG